MKKIFASLLIIISANALYAQDMYNDNAVGENKGFKKENVFIGGSIGLGFGSGSFAVGANPEVGYSVAKWLDAGIVLNINYASQTYYNYYGDNSDLKTSSFNYGAGVFARAYPLPFLFFQLQPEENWIAYKNKYNGFSDKQTVNATSLIGGVGYGQRVIGQGSYFFMVGLDLLHNQYSPYLDGYGHPVPIIRGGFDVYLRPSRRSTVQAPQL